ncbi:hypothetical protein B0A54_11940 [Friedmanniomyces endolithicus]|uniref:BTB domain-containing protein n=1 Tax=Friedmanniomyces endolithicus TaxID=329885 RepID=A0A4V5N6T2_9PEZI|nr:hypothetical protein B0A54_11940 [Friedmanniomyces endolithicus]
MSQEPQGTSQYDITITVLVGKTSTRYIVHQDMIIHGSGFFRKACCGDWKEAHERIVRLASANAGYFHIYLDWLYGPNTDLYANTMGALPEITKVSSPLHKGYVLSHICKLWTLGDFLQDHKFQGAVMAALDAVMAALDAVMAALDANPSTEAPAGPTVEYVVNNTSTGSPLRTWLINDMVRYLVSSAPTTALLDELTDKLPADFLMSLMKTLLSKRKRG